MNTPNANDFAAQYAHAVKRERVAWQALQSHPPGSENRAEAWTEWAQALARTNLAWRRLNSLRLSQPPETSAARAAPLPHNVHTQVSRGCHGSA